MERQKLNLDGPPYRRPLRYLNPLCSDRIACSASAIANHVASAAHRVEERLREALVDFRSQSRNVHVDDICLRIEMIIPDIFQQHRAGDDLAGMPHEIFEQAKLPGLQLYFLAGATYFVRQAVQLQIGYAVNRFLAAAAAPSRQRLDARQQFGKGIRLGQIIVATATQSFDSIVDLAERGEDQDRCFNGLLAQRADDGKAVPLGQHAIDDQNVVIAVKAEL